MAADRSPVARLVVLGGHAATGRALELLLRNTGCSLRFQAEAPRFEETRAGREDQK